MQMTNEHYVPPSPDMSNLVPDGFEHVTTGEPMLGDFVLWRGQWEPLRVLGGRLFEYQMVIRRKPPQKKVRPLTFDEWNDFAGCVFIGAVLDGHWQVQPRTSEHLRKEASGHRLTCHAPGNPADVRNLWAEE